MSSKHYETIFNKIRLLSNRFRFKIIEVTQNQQITIIELSRKLKLSYTKCADYVALLEKYGLIEKIKEGKYTKVRSKAKITSDKIEFM